MILDLFSRYVVGWMIAEQATAPLARHLISTAFERENVAPGQVTLHAEQRDRALSKAYELHPERFVRGQPSAPRPPLAVWINPPERERAEEILRQRGILPVESEVLAQ